MKCKTCNGLGRIKATEFVGVDEGLRKVVILCPTCGGKGEVESLTEQEYIQTCDTEQLAEVLSNISTDAWFAGLNNMDRPVGQKDNWYKWLKKKHNHNKKIGE